MPRVYKFLTAFLALTGCASVVITGETNPLMSISGLAIFPGYYRFLKDEPAAGKWTIGTLSLLALGVFFFDAAVVSGDVVVAVAHLTIAFQAIKSFDLKEPWDNLQVFFVSLLQLIIASELTDSIAFGVVFVLFVVLLVAAMVLSHFVKEGFPDAAKAIKPLSLISFLVLLLTFSLFITLPRASVRLFGKSHVRGIKTSGFSANMDFGSFGNVKLDPTVVMRIIMDRDPHVPLYWRGTTFDYFDGVSWRNSLAGSRTRRYRSKSGKEQYVLSLYDRKRAVEQKVYLEPLDSTVIFGLSQIKAVETDSFSLLTDSASSVYLPGSMSRSIQYTVVSIPADSYPGVAGERYLQLPAGIGRLGDLARRVVEGSGTAAGKAAAIERYLQKNYTYSLSTSRPVKGMSAIEDFLFGSKKGYCEHYATSMVLMLRFLGIPARIVNGFHGGEKNEYGGYIIVRESDAHSWVEALIDGRWTRFDPTPAVAAARPSSFSLFLDSLGMNWSRYVVGFSSRDQLSIIHAFSLPFAVPGMYAPRLRDVSVKYAVYFLLALLCSGGVIWLGVRTARFRGYGFVSGKYVDFRRSLKKKGVRVSPSTTVGDLRKAVRGRAWKSAEEFLALYEESRFGRKEMGMAQKRRYERLLREAKKEK
jgi:transglutaminase-like putative cysteine protease